jgi:hypothetical protein
MSFDSLELRSSLFFRRYLTSLKLSAFDERMRKIPYRACAFEHTGNGALLGVALTIGSIALRK